MKNFALACIILLFGSLLAVKPATGQQWSALGSGVGGMDGSFNPGVWALAWDGENLYAGGDFTTAGGISANYIAKWDGTS
jgi:hypothetical protein